jgi:hypothetical protein
MGTSVRVAKYMNAPTTEANRLAHNELPPTRPLIHDEGIRPFGTWPSEQQPGHKHTGQQQWHDLFGKIPGRRKPGFRLTTSGGHQRHEGDQSRGKGHEGLLGNRQRQDEDNNAGDNQLVKLYPHPTDHHETQKYREAAGQQPFHGITRLPKNHRPAPAGPRWPKSAAHHGGKQEGGLPQRPVDFRFRHVNGSGNLGFFLLAEHQVHEQPDDDAENNRPHGTRRTDLRP